MIFLLNRRFEVDSGKNSITDRTNGQTHYLENRLMVVLSLLIEAKGELVQREQLIDEVWNNYPGANEGINQAISHLRKYFEDDEKALIKTIPKKGYAFNGRIEKDVKKETKTTKTAAWKMNKMGLFLLLLVLLTISFLIYQNTQAVKSRSIDNGVRKNEASMARLDSIHQAETMKKSEKQN